MGGGYTLVQLGWCVGDCGAQTHSNMSPSADLDFQVYEESS